jgi:poly(hydroxyalkanoate) depolymerase family esterase
MNSDFTQALTRAMEQVRTQDLSQATAIIQAALAHALPGQPGPAPDADAPPLPSRIAADATDAETVDVDPNPAVRDAPAAPRRSLREVVELLKSGRAAFDGAAGAARPAFDFSTLPGLSGIDLPGIDLSGLQLPGAARAPAPPLPEGARFEWHTHACAAGSRRYRLFVPSCPASELQGLVMMLHGCKQNPDDFAAGTAMNRHAEDARMLVAWPEQPQGANVSGCWNWFEPAHQRRGAGEPAILADLARSLAAEYALPEGRIFAAGLSAGGAMAAVLAETYPDTFAAVGIHSGLPAGSAHDVVSAFAAMRGQGTAPAGRTDGPRTIVFHGTADHTVSPGNARSIAAALGGAGASPEAGTTGGRGWRRSRDAGEGTARLEVWLVEAAGHAWSGGHPSGSFTDPAGPDASAEMLRFFLAGAA